MRRLSAVVICTGTLLGVALVPGSPGAAKVLRPEVSASVERDFGIFRREYAVQPALAGRLVALVFDGGVAARGSDGVLASFDTVETPSGARMRVVPTRERVCLGASDGGLSCAGPKEVRAGLLTVGSLCTPTLPSGVGRVAGLLPDSVSEVAVVTANGRVAAQVEKNTYVVETRARVVRIEWQQDGELRSFEVGLPDPRFVECASSDGEAADRLD